MASAKLIIRPLVTADYRRAAARRQGRPRPEHAGIRLSASRDYDVEVWENNAWKAVAKVRAAPPAASHHTWPATITHRVRIHRLEGGGPASRPHIMWISEACLYNRGTLN